MPQKPDDKIFEVQSLAGETLAIQAIFFGILPRLAALSPEIRMAIGAGFDDAANLVEQSLLSSETRLRPRTQRRRLRSSRVCAPTPWASQTSRAASFRRHGT
jgi:hypothetical protein